MWVGMISPAFFLRSLKGRCYGNRLLARIGENWHTPPSFCALAFRNGWKDCNMDARVNTADDPSTSDKNSVNFCRVTPEFCGLHAGLCHTFLVVAVSRLRWRFVSAVARAAMSMGHHTIHNCTNPNHIRNRPRDSGPSPRWLRLL